MLICTQAKKTPLESALQIGEEDAAKLIEALLAGKSGDDIGKSADDDLLDIGDGSGDEETPAPTDRSTKAEAKSKGKAEKADKVEKPEKVAEKNSPTPAKEEPAAAKAEDAPYPVAATA